MLTEKRMFLNVVGLVSVLCICLDLHSLADEADDVAKDASGKNLTLEMVQLDVKEHWKQVESKETRVVYMGDPGDVYYVTLNKKAPDLPKLTDEPALRDYFRKSARKEQGGIVHIEVTKVHELDAVIYLTKEVREQIRGYRYVARCVIPFKDASFEIRMDSIEMTVATGAREAVAIVSLGTDVEYEEIPANSVPIPGPKLGKSTGKRIKGWFADPYDPAFDSTAVLSISDDKKFDEHFPDHPLSRLRAKFPVVIEKLKIESSLIWATE